MTQYVTLLALQQTDCLPSCQYIFSYKAISLKDLMFALQEINYNLTQVGIPYEDIELQINFNEETKQGQLVLNLSKQVDLNNLAPQIKEKYQTCLSFLTQKEVNVNQTETALEESTTHPTTSYLWAVQWEESERGWGCRPDGYSFHTSEQEAFKFIKAYNDKLPKEVPDEYSRVVGKPSLQEVSSNLFNYVKQKGSVWLSLNHISDYKNYVVKKKDNS